VPRGAASTVGGDGWPTISAPTFVPAAVVRVDGEPLDHPDGLLLLMHKPTRAGLLTRCA
jgi:hypothetical protein